MKLPGYKACLAGWMFLAVPLARADLIYSFEFTPAATLSGSPLEPVSFSFTSPTFITAPGPLSLTPVFVTNDDISAWIKFGAADFVGNDGCLVLAGSSSQFLSGCGVTGNPVASLLTFNAPFPTAPGEYSLSSVWTLAATGLTGISSTSVGATQLTISQAPLALIDFQGGSSSTPVLLPVDQPVSEITGTVGGPGTSEYYSFFWAGGAFSATASLTNVPDVTGSYLFSAGLSLDSACDGVDSVTLNSSNNFADTIAFDNLAAGQYCIGLAATSPLDPDFALTFTTPVTGASIPEPGGFALFLLGLGTIFALLMTQQRSTPNPTRRGEAEPKGVP